MAVALISCALGCAGSASTTPARSPALGPAETQRLGQEIHALDQAAAQATNVALAAGLQDMPIDGWIVVPGVPGLVVRYVGACPEGACAYLDVQTSSASTPPVALRAAPPRPLPEEQAAMWRARQTAARAQFVPCTRYYNTVVVPRDRDGVWRVYLLATTEDPSERVLTGHYRVRGGIL